MGEGIILSVYFCWGTHSYFSSGIHFCNNIHTFVSPSGVINNFCIKYILILGAKIVDEWDDFYFIQKSFNIFYVIIVDVLSTIIMAYSDNFYLFYFILY